MEVVTVGVLEGASLLDGEDLLPGGEHRIQLGGRESRQLDHCQRSVSRGIVGTAGVAVSIVPNIAQSARRVEDSGGLQREPRALALLRRASTRSEVVRERASHRGGDQREIGLRHPDHSDPVVALRHESLRGVPPVACVGASVRSSGGWVTSIRPPP